MFKLEEGWLTVVLMSVMLTVAGWGVAVASWTQGLWAAWLASVVGILAGLALAKSRFSGFVASLFAIVYGLFYVGFLVCFMLEGSWHERSLELVTRLGTFIYKATFGGTSRDALPFPVFISLVFWFIGVIGAWSVFRRRSVWLAVIPGGVGLLINAYYYLGPARIDLYLAVYMLLALLLVARVSLFAREQEWQAARVAYNPEIRFDFLRAGLVVALAGVMVGWAGPELAASPAAASAWQQMTGPWSKVREQWMRLFASLRAYGQNVNDFYGDSLILGGASHLDNDPIMDVAIGPTDELALEASGPTVAPRYYWRMQAYDEYHDGRWQTTKLEFKEYKRTDLLRLPAYRLRRDVTANIQSYVGASSRLYTPSQPRRVDRIATYELAYTPGGAADVASVRVLAPEFVRRGDVYQVVASVSVADQASLRADDADYPEWVASRYLQLPDTITDRTRELAQQIVQTAGATNPFDQAQAITTWLRQNITYDLDIDAPPPDVDPVDYVLFTSRRGYCNYYASAEVILLRSLGIPARLAVGMAQGEFDPEAGLYRVVERNAHAWPEVFFPDHGWVEFEPTASEPLLVRPERPATTDSSGSLVSPDAEDRASQRADREQQEKDIPDPLSGPRSNIWLLRLQEMSITAGLVIFGAIVAAAAGLALMLRFGLIGWESLGAAGVWVMRRRGLPIPSIVTAAYLKLERAARWLGLALPVTFTPYERAIALSQSLPEVRPGVETITEQYVTEQYSPHVANPAAAEAAWQEIRVPVWRQAVREFIRGWIEGEPAKVPPKKPQSKPR
ncbi:MAG TPA: transglutaminase-like domain-containing protein [Anaerolineales bacterium]|nr:transglutaminase-like domain-containing protein [Anaerolineales bacterium]